MLSRSTFAPATSAAPLLSVPSPWPISAADITHLLSPGGVARILAFWLPAFRTAKLHIQRAVDFDSALVHSGEIRGGRGSFRPPTIAAPATRRTGLDYDAAGAT